ncbi:hypothetical protein TUM20249_43020 [Pseudomonas tohonis]|nr:hypothetical protein TUM20249_43020 [Pseudomonas tohonis]
MFLFDGLAMHQQVALWAGNQLLKGTFGQRAGIGRVRHTGGSCEFAPILDERSRKGSV